MASGPQLTSLNLWEQREQKCVCIIRRALLLLKQTSSLPTQEESLNRLLYARLLEASRELYPEDDIAPVYECNNQPDLEDEVRSSREGKRPDFQWIFLDRYEPDPHRSSKQYVVECKRLGSPERQTWVFNANYVLNGAMRFKNADWGYGKRFASGAMIGYLQSMEPDDVLSEVNATAFAAGLPGSTFTTPWNRSLVNVMEHVLTRPFAVSPFRLGHLWIDLRPESTTCPTDESAQPTSVSLPTDA